MRWNGSWFARIWILVLLASVAGAGCSRNNAQAFFDRGAARFHDGDYDGAIEAYTRGIDLEPGSAVGHNLLGMAYRMKFNGTGATEWKEKEITAFREAVETDSTYWPAYINLGASLYYMGRKDEAAPFFSRALALHPDNPEREQLESFIREGGGTVPAAPGSDSDSDSDSNSNSNSN